MNKHLFNKLFAGLFFLMLLTSCLSAKKYRKIVKAELAGEVVVSKDWVTDQITVSLDGPKVQDSLVQTEKRRAILIPLIFYTYSQNTIKCDLDPSVPATICFNSIRDYSQLPKLKEKLADRQLEIHINGLPTSFVWSNEVHFLFYVTGYLYHGGQTIRPEKRNLIVTYRILDKGIVQRTGTLTIENNDESIVNVMSSYKRFTNDYLTQYKVNMQVMSQKVVDALVKELQ